MLECPSVELEAQPKLLDLDRGDALPNLPISRVVVDERDLYRSYHCYPKGTVAQLATPVQVAEKQPRAQPYADRLDAFRVLWTRSRNRAKPELILGAQQIKERLERKGTQVRLSPDRQSIIPSGNSIHFAAAYAAAPRLWPYHADGKPPTCRGARPPRAGRRDQGRRRIPGRAAVVWGAVMSEPKFPGYRPPRLDDVVPPRLEDYIKPQTPAERASLANAYARRDINRRFRRVIPRLDARLDAVEKRQQARRWRR